MIAKISGRLVEKKDNAVVLQVQGICYEVMAPLSVLQRIDDHLGAQGEVTLITHHYMQITPSSGMPVLVGFLNEVERDFFLEFIKVSGIGPRAAIRALDKPISEIAQAIEEGNQQYLKTLPGIGIQKAKEIVAKLQGKMGKYGLIQDQKIQISASQEIADWQQEVLEILLQLQYKKPEALTMIDAVLKRLPGINSAEQLLNEIYRQKVRK